MPSHCTHTTHAQHMPYTHPITTHTHTHHAHHIHEVCPEGIQPCNVKNRNIYRRTDKVQETLHIGQWSLTPLQSRHLWTSHSSPNCHQLAALSYFPECHRWSKISSLSFFLKRFYLLILERGREGEWEGEKHRCVVASHAPPTRDLACNPGMGPKLGIELAILWFAGLHSIHWVTPARTLNLFPFKGDFSFGESQKSQGTTSGL